MKESLLYWVPRILLLGAILFISLFALDAFQEGKSFWENLGAFLVHLIPSFFMGIILFIAWRWEKIGGIILLVISIGLTPVIFWLNYRNNHSVWISLLIILMINAPFILSGVLFLLHHRLIKKSQVAHG